MGQDYNGNGFEVQYGKSAIRATGPVTTLVAIAFVILGVTVGFGIYAASKVQDRTVRFLAEIQGNGIDKLQTEMARTREMFHKVQLDILDVGRASAQRTADLAVEQERTTQAMEKLNQSQLRMIEILGKNTQVEAAPERPPSAPTPGRH